MIDYKELIKDYLPKKVNDLTIPIKPSSKLNFIKNNDIYCKLALINQFLDKKIIIDDDILSNIKTNMDYFINNDYESLDLGLFKTKVYQSETQIGIVYINDKTKLSENNLTSCITNLFKIVNYVFVRPKLSVIYTEISPLYILAYTVKHGQEINISIQDCFENYKSIITSDYLSKKIALAEKKNKTEEEIKEQKTLENLNIDNAIISNDLHFDNLTTNLSFAI